MDERAKKESKEGKSQTFSLRNDQETDIRQSQVPATTNVGRYESLFDRKHILGKTESVFDNENGRKSLKPKTADSKKPGSSQKKDPIKKKKLGIEIDSEECLRIEFAELLTEPENRYIPSLHGWRDWDRNSEWIDPDGARTDAVKAVEERGKQLPSKKEGPPLP